MSLTFAEQVKIVLERRKMTIKELAEQIEAATGRKMSRQNLTQKLGRNNFQEQDMRLITEVLGCKFTLDILGEVVEVAKEEEKGAVEVFVENEVTIDEVLQMDTPEAAREYVKEHTAQEENKEDLMADLYREMEAIEEESRAHENKQKQKALEKKKSWKDYLFGKKEEESSVEEGTIPEDPVFEEQLTGVDSMSEFLEAEKHPDEKKAKDLPDLSEEGDIINGEINPYTNFEYKSNSVRTHPTRIGYVQVYDRKTHTWSDMTEWAFLGYQERQKYELGEDYIPPVYLD